MSITKNGSGVIVETSPAGADVLQRAGVSFTISSTEGADDRTVAFLMIQPA